MRKLVILASLVWALHAASLPISTDVQYKCQEDQDNIATLEAERFINDHHHEGYTFKFVSLDGRSAKNKVPCEVILGITLEETECHIVNPKPLNQCNSRTETETKVTSKCNVTMFSVEGTAAVKCFICDTRPASHEMANCSDCHNLLPLHDRKGMESVKAAMQKFNKISNQKSYFKLIEVGRLSTKVLMWISMDLREVFSMSFTFLETAHHKRAVWKCGGLASLQHGQPSISGLSSAVRELTGKDFCVWHLVLSQDPQKSAKASHVKVVQLPSMPVHTPCLTAMYQGGKHYCLVDFELCNKGQGYHTVVCSLPNVELALDIL